MLRQFSRTVHAIMACLPMICPRAQSSKTVWSRRYQPANTLAVGLFAGGRRRRLCPQDFPFGTFTVLHVPDLPWRHGTGRAKLKCYCTVRLESVCWWSLASRSFAHTKWMDLSASTPSASAVKFSIQSSVASCKALSNGPGPLAQPLVLLARCVR